MCPSTTQTNQGVRHNIFRCKVRLKTLHNVVVRGRQRVPVVDVNPIACVDGHCVITKQSDALVDAPSRPGTASCARVHLHKAPLDTLVVQPAGLLLLHAEVDDGNEDVAPIVSRNRFVARPARRAVVRDLEDCR